MAVIFFADETARAASSVMSAGSAVRPAAAALSDPLSAAIANPAALPSAADAVRAERFMAGTNGKLIVLVRDAHANLSAQKNLAKAAGLWAKEAGIDLILSEAAWGEAGLSDAREALPAKRLKKAADRLLWDNLITGHEYLSLMPGPEVRIIGIEDPELYRRNWEVFRRMTLGRAKVNASMVRSRGIVDGMKRRDYPKELIRYESTTSDADDWTRRYGEIRDLADRSGVRLDASAGSVLEPFRQLEAAERSMDHERLSREQERAFAEAASRCGDCTQDLIDAFTKAGPSVATLLSALGQLARATGREAWESGTELERYEKYLRSVGSLDAQAMSDALETLEQDLYDQLAPSRDARVTRFVDRHTALLDAAYRLKLTPEETRRLNTELRSVKPLSWQAELNDRLIQQDRAEDVLEYEPELAARLVTVRNFYRLAALRDKVFARRSDEALSRSGKSAAVLVAGGYHTDHLTKLLADRGYSVAVFTPYITDETDQAAYEKSVLGPDPGSVSGLLRPDAAQTPSEADEPRAADSSALLAPLARTAPGAARLAAAALRLTGDAAVLAERVSKLPRGSLSDQIADGADQDLLDGSGHDVRTFGARMANPRERADEQSGERYAAIHKALLGPLDAFNDIDSVLEWYGQNQRKLPDKADETRPTASFMVRVLTHAGKIAPSNETPFRFSANAYDYASRSDLVRNAPVMLTAADFLDWYGTHRARLVRKDERSRVSAGYIVLALIHAGKIDPSRQREFQYQGGAYDYGADSRAVRLAPRMETFDDFVGWFEENQDRMPKLNGSDRLSAGYAVQVLAHAGKIEPGKVQNFQREAGAIDYALESEPIRTAPEMKSFDEFVTWYEINRDELLSKSGDHALSASYLVFILAGAGKIDRSISRSLQIDAAAYDYARQSDVIRNAPQMKKFEDFLVWFKRERKHLVSRDGSSILSATYTLQVLRHVGKVRPADLRSYQVNAGAYERASKDKEVILGEIGRIFAAEPKAPYRSDLARLKSEFDVRLLPSLASKDRKPLSRNYRNLILTFAYREYGREAIRQTGARMAVAGRPGDLVKRAASVRDGVEVSVFKENGLPTAVSLGMQSEGLTVTIAPKLKADTVAAHLEQGGMSRMEAADAATRQRTSLWTEASDRMRAEADRMPRGASTDGRTVLLEAGILNAAIARGWTQFLRPAGADADDKSIYIITPYGRFPSFEGSEGEWSHLGPTAPRTTPGPKAKTRPAPGTGGARMAQTTDVEKGKSENSFTFFPNAQQLMETYPQIQGNPDLARAVQDLRSRAIMNGFWVRQGAPAEPLRIYLRYADDAKARINLEVYRAGAEAGFSNLAEVTELENGAILTRMAQSYTRDEWRVMRAGFEDYFLYVTYFGDLDKEIVRNEAGRVYTNTVLFKSDDGVDKHLMIDFEKARWIDGVSGSQDDLVPRLALKFMDRLSERYPDRRKKILERLDELELKPGQKQLFRARVLEIFEQIDDKSRSGARMSQLPMAALTEDTPVRELAHATGLWDKGRVIRFFTEPSSGLQVYEVEAEIDFESEMPDGTGILRQLFEFKWKGLGRRNMRFYVLFDERHMPVSICPKEGQVPESVWRNDLAVSPTGHWIYYDRLDLAPYTVPSHVLRDTGAGLSKAAMATEFERLADLRNKLKRFDDYFATLDQGIKGRPASERIVGSFGASGFSPFVYLEWDGRDHRLSSLSFNEQALTDPSRGLRDYHRSDRFREENGLDREDFFERMFRPAERPRALWVQYPRVYSFQKYLGVDSAFRREVYETMRLEAATRLKEGDAVADLGTGTGLSLWVAWIAALPSRLNLRYFASDLNPMAVANARFNFRLNGMTVQTVLADVMLAQEGRTAFPVPIQFLLGNAPAHSGITEGPEAEMTDPDPDRNVTTYTHQDGGETALHFWDRLIAQLNDPGLMDARRGTAVLWNQQYSQTLIDRIGALHAVASAELIPADASRNDPAGYATYQIRFGPKLGRFGLRLERMRADLDAAYGIMLRAVQNYPERERRLYLQLASRFYLTLPTIGVVKYLPMTALAASGLWWTTLLAYYAAPITRLGLMVYYRLRHGLPMGRAISFSFVPHVGTFLALPAQVLDRAALARARKVGVAAAELRKAATASAAPVRVRRTVLTHSLKLAEAVTDWMETNGGVSAWVLLGPGSTRRSIDRVLEHGRKVLFVGYRSAPLIDELAEWKWSNRLYGHPSVSDLYSLDLGRAVSALVSDDAPQAGSWIRPVDDATGGARMASTYRHGEPVDVKIGTEWVAGIYDRRVGNGHRIKFESPYGEDEAEDVLISDQWVDSRVRARSTAPAAVRSDIDAHTFGASEHLEPGVLSLEASRRAFGESPTEKTTITFFNSIGRFSDLKKWQDLPGTGYRRSKFVLSDEGVEFVMDLIKYHILSSGMEPDVVNSRAFADRVVGRQAYVLSRTVDQKNVPYGLSILLNNSSPLYIDISQIFSGLGKDAFALSVAHQLFEDLCHKLAERWDQSGAMLIYRIQSMTRPDEPHQKNQLLPAGSDPAALQDPWTSYRDPGYKLEAGGGLTLFHVVGIATAGNVGTTMGQDMGIFFAPDDIHSSDWQGLIHQYLPAHYTREELSRLRIGLIGYGDAVDILQLVREGARSIYSTDINRFNKVLADLNIQFGRDTGQIPPGTQIVTELKSGMPSQDDLDLLMMNVPGISEDLEQKTPQARAGYRYVEPSVRSFTITLQDFYALMDPIALRLDRDPKLKKFIFRINADLSQRGTRTSSGDMMIPAVALWGDAQRIMRRYPRLSLSYLNGSFFEASRSGARMAADQALSVIPAQMALAAVPDEAVQATKMFNERFAVRLIALPSSPESARVKVQMLDMSTPLPQDPRPQIDIAGPASGRGLMPWIFALWARSQEIVKDVLDPARTATVVWEADYELAPDFDLSEEGLKNFALQFMPFTKGFVSNLRAAADGDDEDKDTFLPRVESSTHSIITDALTHLQYWRLYEKWTTEHSEAGTFDGIRIVLKPDYAMGRDDDYRVSRIHRTVTVIANPYFNLLNNMTVELSHGLAELDYPDPLEAVRRFDAEVRPEWHVMDASTPDRQIGVNTYISHMLEGHSSVYVDTIGQGEGWRRFEVRAYPKERSRAPGAPQGAGFQVTLPDHVAAEDVRRVVQNILDPTLRAEEDDTPGRDNLKQKTLLLLGMGDDEVFDQKQNGMDDRSQGARMSSSSVLTRLDFDHFTSLDALKRSGRVPPSIVRRLPSSFDGDTEPGFYIKKSGPRNAVYIAYSHHAPRRRLRMSTYQSSIAAGFDNVAEHLLLEDGTLLTRLVESYSDAEIAGRHTSVEDMFLYMMAYRDTDHGPTETRGESNVHKRVIKTSRGFEVRRMLYDLGDAGQVWSAAERGDMAEDLIAYKFREGMTLDRERVTERLNELRLGRDLKNQMTNIIRKYLPSLDGARMATGSLRTFSGPILALTAGFATGFIPDTVRWVLSLGGTVDHHNSWPVLLGAVAAHVLWDLVIGEPADLAESGRSRAEFWNRLKRRLVLLGSFFSGVFASAVYAVHFVQVTTLYQPNCIVLNGMAAAVIMRAAAEAWKREIIASRRGARMAAGPGPDVLSAETIAKYLDAGDKPELDLLIADMGRAFSDLAAWGLRPQARHWTKYHRMMREGRITTEHLFMLRSFGLELGILRAFASALWRERLKQHLTGEPVWGGEEMFWDELLPESVRAEAVPEFNEFIAWYLFGLYDDEELKWPGEYPSRQVVLEGYVNFLSSHLPDQLPGLARALTEQQNIRTLREVLGGAIDSIKGIQEEMDAAIEDLGISKPAKKIPAQDPMDNDVSMFAHLVEENDFVHAYRIMARNPAVWKIYEGRMRRLDYGYLNALRVMKRLRTQGWPEEEYWSHVGGYLYKFVVVIDPARIRHRVRRDARFRFELYQAIRKKLYMAHGVPSYDEIFVDREQIRHRYEPDPTPIINSIMTRESLETLLTLDLSHDGHYQPLIRGLLRAVHPSKTSGARMAHEEDHRAGFEAALAEGKGLSGRQLKRKIAEAERWFGIMHAAWAKAYYEGMMSGFHSLIPLRKSGMWSSLTGWVRKRSAARMAFRLPEGYEDDVRRAGSEGSILWHGDVPADKFDIRAGVDTLNTRPLTKEGKDLATRLLASRPGPVEVMDLGAGAGMFVSDVSRLAGSAGGSVEIDTVSLAPIAPHWRLKPTAQFWSDEPFERLSTAYLRRQYIGVYPENPDLYGRRYDLVHDNKGAFYYASKPSSNSLQAGRRALQKAYSMLKPEGIFFYESMDPLDELERVFDPENERPDGPIFLYADWLEALMIRGDSQMARAVRSDPRLHKRNEHSYEAGAFSTLLAVLFPSSGARMAVRRTEPGHGDPVSARVQGLASAISEDAGDEFSRTVAAILRYYDNIFGWGAGDPAHGSAASSRRLKHMAHLEKLRSKLNAVPGIRMTLGVGFAYYGFLDPRMRMITTLGQVMRGELTPAHGLKRMIPDYDYLFVYDLGQERETVSAESPYLFHKQWLDHTNGAGKSDWDAFQKSLFVDDVAHVNPWGPAEPEIESRPSRYLDSVRSFLEGRLTLDVAHPTPLLVWGAIPYFTEPEDDAFVPMINDLLLLNDSVSPEVLPVLNAWKKNLIVTILGKTPMERGALMRAIAARRKEGGHAPILFSVPGAFEAFAADWGGSLQHVLSEGWVVEREGVYELTESGRAHDRAVSDKRSAILLKGYVDRADHFPVVGGSGARMANGAWTQPSLSSDHEIDIAHLMRTKRGQVLSRSEEVAVFRRYRDPELSDREREAVQLFIAESQRPYLRSQADLHAYSRDEFERLEQAGLTAIALAVPTFDLDLGYRFNTWYKRPVQWAMMKEKRDNPVRFDHDSLDSPFSEEEDGDRHDRIADPSGVDSWRSADARADLEVVMRALGTLDWKDRLIFKLRRGIGIPPGRKANYTQGEIGAYFGLSPQAVSLREIAAEAAIKTYLTSDEKRRRLLDADGLSGWDNSDVEIFGSTAAQPLSDADFERRLEISLLKADQALSYRRILKGMDDQLHVLEPYLDPSGPGAQTVDADLTRPLRDLLSVLEEADRQMQRIKKGISLKVADKLSEVHRGEASSWSGISSATGLSTTTLQKILSNRHSDGVSRETQLKLSQGLRVPFNEWAPGLRDVDDTEDLELQFADLIRRSKRLFGKALYLAHHGYGLSYREMAVQAGVPVQIVSKAAHAQRLLSIEQVRSITRSLVGRKQGFVAASKVPLSVDYQRTSLLHEIVNQFVGKQLRTIAAQKGYTLAELADRLDIKYNDLLAAVNDRYDGNMIAQVPMMAKKLDLEPADLLAGAENYIEELERIRSSLGSRAEAAAQKFQTMRRDGLGMTMGQLTRRTGIIKTSLMRIGKNDKTDDPVGLLVRLQKIADALKMPLSEFWPENDLFVVKTRSLHLIASGPASGARLAESAEGTRRATIGRAVKLAVWGAFTVALVRSAPAFAKGGIFWAPFLWMLGQLWIFTLAAPVLARRFTSQAGRVAAVGALLTVLYVTFHLLPGGTDAWEGIGAAASQIAQRTLVVFGSLFASAVVFKMAGDLRNRRALSAWRTAGFATRWSLLPSLMTGFLIYHVFIPFTVSAFPEVMDRILWDLTWGTLLGTLPAKIASSAFSEEQVRTHREFLAGGMKMWAHLLPINFVFFYLAMMTGWDVSVGMSDFAQGDPALEFFLGSTPVDSYLRFLAAAAFVFRTFEVLVLSRPNPVDRESGARLAYQQMPQEQSLSGVSLEKAKPVILRRPKDMREAVIDRMAGYGLIGFEASMRLFAKRWFGGLILWNRATPAVRWSLKKETSFPPQASDWNQDPERAADYMVQADTSAPIHRYRKSGLLEAVLQILGHDTLRILANEQMTVDAKVLDGTDPDYYEVRVGSQVRWFTLRFRWLPEKKTVVLGHGGLKIRDVEFTRGQLAAKARFDAELLGRFVRVASSGDLVGEVPERIICPDVYGAQVDLFRSVGFEVTIKPNTEIPGGSAVYEVRSAGSRMAGSKWIDVPWSKETVEAIRRADHPSLPKFRKKPLGGYRIRRVEGPRLEHWLRSSESIQISDDDAYLRQTVGWILQVLEAVLGLHLNGMQHGDLTARNIVIENDRVSGHRPVLIDFEDEFMNDHEAAPGLLADVLMSRQLIYMNGLINVNELMEAVRKRFEDHPALLKMAYAKYPSVLHFYIDLARYASEKWGYDSPWFQAIKDLVGARMAGTVHVHVVHSGRISSKLGQGEWTGYPQPVRISNLGSASAVRQLEGLEVPDGDKGLIVFRVPATSSPDVVSEHGGGDRFSTLGACDALPRDMERYFARENIGRRSKLPVVINLDAPVTDRLRSRLESLKSRGLIAGYLDGPVADPDLRWLAAAYPDDKWVRVNRTVSGGWSVTAMRGAAEAALEFGRPSDAAAQKEFGPGPSLRARVRPLSLTGVLMARSIALPSMDSVVLTQGEEGVRIGIRRAHVDLRTKALELNALLAPFGIAIADERAWTKGPGTSSEPDTSVLGARMAAGAVKLSPQESARRIKNVVVWGTVVVVVGAVLDTAIAQTTGFSVGRWVIDLQREPGWRSWTGSAAITVLFGIWARVNGMYLSDSLTRISPAVLASMLGAQLLWRPILGVTQDMTNWYVAAHIQAPYLKPLISAAAGMSMSIVFDILEPMAMARIDAARRRRSGDPEEIAKAEQQLIDTQLGRQTVRVSDGVFGRVVWTYLQHGAAQLGADQAYRSLVIQAVGLGINSFRSWAAYARDSRPSAKGVLKSGLTLTAVMFVFFPPSVGITSLVLTAVGSAYFKWVHPPAPAPQGARMAVGRRPTTGVNIAAQLNHQLKPRGLKIESADPGRADGSLEWTVVGIDRPLGADVAVRLPKLPTSGTFGSQAEIDAWKSRADSGPDLSLFTKLSVGEFPWVADAFSATFRIRSADGVLHRVTIPVAVTQRFTGQDEQPALSTLTDDADAREKVYKFGTFSQLIRMMLLADWADRKVAGAEQIYDAFASKNLSYNRVSGWVRFEGFAVMPDTVPNRSKRMEDFMSAAKLILRPSQHAQLEERMRQSGVDPAHPAAEDADRILGLLRAMDDERIAADETLPLAVRHFAAKMLKQGVAVRTEEELRSRPGGMNVAYPADTADKTLASLAALRSGEPLGFSEGWLYHGTYDLKSLLAAGQLASGVKFTREAANYAIPPQALTTVPAIIVLETSEFNEALRSGTADLQLTGDRRQGGVDPYPILTRPMSLEHVREIWVPEGADLEAVKAVASRALREKIVPVPGWPMFSDQGIFKTENGYSAQGRAIKRYLINRDLLVRVPEFRALQPARTATVRTEEAQGEVSAARLAQTAELLPRPSTRSDLAELDPDIVITGPVRHYLARVRSGAQFAWAVTSRGGEKVAVRVTMAAEGLLELRTERSVRPLANILVSGRAAAAEGIDPVGAGAPVSQIAITRPSLGETGGPAQKVRLREKRTASDPISTAFVRLYENINGSEERFAVHDVARYWSEDVPAGASAEENFKLVLRSLLGHLQGHPQWKVRFTYNGTPLDRAVPAAWTDDDKKRAAIAHEILADGGAHFGREFPAGAHVIGDLAVSQAQVDAAAGRGVSERGYTGALLSQDTGYRPALAVMMAQLALSTDAVITDGDPVLDILGRLTGSPKTAEEANWYREGRIDRIAALGDWKRFTILRMGARLAQTIERTAQAVLAAAQAA